MSFRHTGLAGYGFGNVVRLFAVSNEMISNHETKQSRPISWLTFTGLAHTVPDVAEMIMLSPGRHSLGETTLRSVADACRPRFTRWSTFDHPAFRKSPASDGARVQAWGRDTA